ncbi:PAS domain-containing protein [Actinomycetospora cinnamomea]|uniref:Histidine kinase/DNA gyrase B/HSP90-like ATPase n=1 Tax=Actinomycetospora cinnamomea TaxID=663609 RepID=A0A2U1FIB8_9PSEU|nr:PAS domain-containing protein [Actinomycetospora cinnamomea]PVZ11924.1 histidine kinase/DNA gyrase B/HSP90-like ATPase [Actinomycetospora cinnamomea]
MPRTDPRAVVGVDVTSAGFPAMVARWDADELHGYANDAYARWFGKEPADLRGMTLEDLLGPRLYEVERPAVQEALGGRTRVVVRTIVDERGEPRDAQVSYVPDVEGGRVVGFFVIATDLATGVEIEGVEHDRLARLALVEERQRIAADLHDTVLQRLFATGLGLTLALNRADGAAGPLLAALEGIDDAVVELRAAIVTMTGELQPAELASSIARIVGHAARSLRNAPEVTYRGPLQQVRPGVARQLLAVLSEALSNVVRHAEAEHVAITITTSPDEVRLVVSDDGEGIPETANPSGLANMQRRAAALGGTFGWRARSPRGTVLEWAVPQDDGPTDGA